MERNKQHRHEKTRKEFIPHTRSSHLITTNNNFTTEQQPEDAGKPPPVPDSRNNDRKIFKDTVKYRISENDSDKYQSIPQEKHTTGQKLLKNEDCVSKIITKVHNKKQNGYKEPASEKQKHERNTEGKVHMHAEKPSRHGTNFVDTKTSQQQTYLPQTGTKSGKIPIRRSASIDVGELNRKKKGRRSKKKGNIDKETIVAKARTELMKSDAGRLNKRSGSVGNRPTSLKLSQSNSAQNFFPTPLPQTRLSRSSKSDLEKLHSSSRLNSVSSNTDVPFNDKTAILPLKQTIPSISIDIYDEDDDDDDLFDRDFPTGEGYRKHGRKLNFPSSPYFRLKPPVIKRLWVRIVGLILYSVLAFMVFCPFAVIILVTLPVCIIIKTSFMCCFSCCCRLNQGEECVCCFCGQRLSLTERFWIQNEMQDRNIVQSLIIVEYGLTVPQIINLVNNRLVLVKDNSGKRLYPRFSQKIVKTCSNYVWKEDSDFFIHNHVFAMPKGIESLEDLQDYISDNASHGITFEKPLWELHVLTDFGDLRDTVLLFRMHPCLSDGVSMVHVLYKSFADVDSVTTVPPYLGRESCLDRLKSYFYGPLYFFKKLTFSSNDFNLLHCKHAHLSGKKVITWSEPFSLANATRIKQVTRSTLGEVLMSVAAGSIRNYFILNGISHPYDIQSSIPVYHSTTSCPSGIANNVIMLKVTLPTNTEGVVPRLWQMKECMCQLRESSVFSLTKRMLQLSHSVLAGSCWGSFWRRIMKKCTCIISSLPGPEVNLRLSSKQVKTIFYWFPPIQQVALAISFFTYGDQLQMAVSADRAVLPNPELIAKDFIFQVSDFSFISWQTYRIYLRKKSTSDQFWPRK